MGLTKREYIDKETLITAESLNDMQDAILALEDGLFTVDNDKSGEVISITDAAKRGFRSLNIYGKTTQDGTPTPDAPVDLVSAGADGDISVNVCGLQLANTTKSLTNPNVISITEQGKRVEVASTSAYVNAQFALSLSPNTDYVLSYTTNLVSGQYNAKIIGIDYNGAETSVVVSVATPLAFNSGKYSSWKVAFYSTIELSKNPVFENIMVNIGTSALPWEAYKGQTATVLTPNGLPGIPVSSGGNYTDANGQQWICDEIDFARGVYIKRIGQVTLTGEESGWIYFESASTVNQFYIPISVRHVPNDIGAMCAYYRPHYLDKRDGNFGIIYTRSDGIAFNTNECTSVDGWRALLKERPTTVLYILATPIERPLSAEELAAYAALYTYKDNTTVSNDAGVWMELEYVMDAKKYIDSLVAEPMARLSSVSLPASKWVGSNSLYSQVVTIPGITENSKVDLLPSVEQLAIFFNKNVSFVTENEDGVVTVYAIGDKPLLDYTMQVQITEVAV